MVLLSILSTLILLYTKENTDARLFFGGLWWGVFIVFLAQQLGVV